MTWGDVIAVGSAAVGAVMAVVATIAVRRSTRADSDAAAGHATVDVQMKDDQGNVEYRAFKVSVADGERLQATADAEQRKADTGDGRPVGRATA